MNTNDVPVFVNVESVYDAVAMDTPVLKDSLVEQIRSGTLVEVEMADGSVRRFTDPHVFGAWYDAIAKAGKPTDPVSPQSKS